MTNKMDLLGRLELQVVRDPSTGNRKVVFRNQDGELLDPADNPELMATLGAGGVTQADLSAALATKANASSLAAKVDTAALNAAISAQHTVDNGTYAPKRRPSVALLGDSISNQDADNGVTSSTGFWFNAKGYFTWANILLRQRLSELRAAPTVGLVSRRRT
jgi:hypothetical protein